MRRARLHAAEEAGEQGALRVKLRKEVVGVPKRALRDCFSRPAKARGVEDNPGGHAFEQAVGSFDRRGLLPLNCFRKPITATLGFRRCLSALLSFPADVRTGQLGIGVWGLGFGILRTRSRTSPGLPSFVCLLETEVIPRRRFTLHHVQSHHLRRLAVGTVEPPYRRWGAW